MLVAGAQLHVFIPKLIRSTALATFAYISCAHPQTLVGPSAAAEGGVAWGLVYVRCGGDRAVELHTAPIRCPSPRIRACIVCVEGVRGAVCAAVSSLRKLSSGGYRCHDRFPSDSW
jgi:hypothetical protein